jgi:hypothetical protein
MLLMLEDNAERVSRFTATIKAVNPALPFRLWRNAWSMIRESALSVAHFGVRRFLRRFGFFALLFCDGKTKESGVGNAALQNAPASVSS